MENLKIDTGTKRIMINDDPNNVLEFNPADVAFAEAFYQLMKNFEEKQVEYSARAEALDKNKAVDSTGVPINFQEGMELLREINIFMRGEIDILFGAGTSQKLFGNAVNLQMFTQLFEGITPFIASARVAKVSAYAPVVKSKVKKHKKNVMS
jgi:hypothetical protein